MFIYLKCSHYMICYKFIIIYLRLSRRSTKCFANSSILVFCSFIPVCYVMLYTIYIYICYLLVACIYIQLCIYMYYLLTYVFIVENSLRPTRVLLFIILIITFTHYSVILLLHREAFF